MAFPDYSEGQRFSIEKKYYRYLADLITESAKGFTAGESFFRKRISYKHIELLNALHDEKKSAIVVMSHCGNWEWICRSSPFFLKNKVVVAYKPLSNKAFDRLMYKTRSQFGAVQVPMSGVGRFILQEKDPFLLILLADQSPSDANSSHWMRFLNVETAVLPGVGKLANKFKLPVYYSDVKKLRRGYYQCVISQLSDAERAYQPEEISKIHTAFTEERIKEHPETWLWSHRRWKLKKTD